MAPLDTLPDDELASRAASGDQEAFAALYERYFEPVYDFLVRMVRNRDDAADIAQDTFVRAMKGLPNLGNTAAFKGWLFTIARNTALNRIERRGREQPLIQEDAEGEEYGFDVVDTTRLGDPERAAEAQAVAAIVWEAAASLDERQQSVLQLTVRQGMESGEIAEVLGVTKNNAYVMVNRAKAALEEAVSALVLVRDKRQRCPSLDRLLAGAEPTLTPELRRLVDRHLTACDTCQERKRRLIAPLVVFGALAPVAAPMGLKESIAAFLAQTAVTAPPAPADASTAAQPSGVAGVPPGGTIPPAQGMLAEGGAWWPRRTLAIAAGGVGLGLLLLLLVPASPLAVTASGGGGSQPLAVAPADDETPAPSPSPGATSAAGAPSPSSSPAEPTTAAAGEASVTPTNPPVAGQTPTPPPTSANQPGPTTPGVAPRSGSTATPTPPATSTARSTSTTTSTPPATRTSTPTPTRTSTPTPTPTPTPTITPTPTLCPPALSLGGTTLVAVGNGSSGSIPVSNTGCANMPVSASVTSGGGWLSVTSALNVPGGQTQALSVSVNRTALGEGPSQGTVQVSAAGSGAPVTVTATKTGNAPSVDGITANCPTSPPNWPATIIVAASDDYGISNVTMAWGPTGSGLPNSAALAPSGGVWAVTVNRLTPSSHTFVVTARDRAGQTATASASC